MELNWQLLSVQLFHIGDTPVTVATLLTLVFILIGTYWLSRMIQRAIRTVLEFGGVDDEGTIGVTARLAHYFIMITGLAVALQTMGVNLSGLFAAGALFAVGIGFATQNVLQNFLSGVILLSERAIKPGDILEVEGRVVRVSRLGFRTTVVKTRDEEDLIVPNATLVQSTVKNYTLRDSFYRMRTIVGVSYGSDMHLVRQTLEKVANEQPYRRKDMEPAILLAEFGNSSVNFDVSVWVDDPWATQRMKSRLNESIWWGLKEAGITIAFPQVDVHFDPGFEGAVRELSQPRLQQV